MAWNYSCDLVVLVADADQYQTIKGLLDARTESLNNRPPRAVTILKHLNRDAGCFNGAVGVLQPFLAKAHHALVVFDLEGSGQENRRAVDLEENLNGRLRANGWGDRASAIVIDPELESWVWSDSPHVEEVLGWESRQPRLRDWLKQRGLWGRDRRAAKPARPQECMDAALRQVSKRRSASLFAELASRVGVERCVDPAFQRLRVTLRNWFPPGGNP